MLHRMATVPRAAGPVYWLISLFPVLTGFSNQFYYFIVPPIVGGRRLVGSHSIPPTTEGNFLGVRRALEAEMCNLGLADRMQWRQAAVLAVEAW
jgi:hypothetical protein